ncbi:MAG: hypothetical protein RLZZ65_1825, partial [Bacteroidota bacterium]
FDELAQIRIERNTMVWHDGMPNWKEAKDIDDLSGLFKNQPPPFQGHQQKTPPPEFKAERQYSETKASSENSNSRFGLIAFIAIVLALIAYLFVNQQIQQEQMGFELKNQQQQLEQQEAEKRAEEERLAEEARQAEIRDLKRQYDNAVNKLRAANIKLQEVQEFHFLRTFEEKDQQIAAQLNVVRSWENEVARLKNRLNQY